MEVLDIKILMTEIKIIVDGIISQFDYAEEKISVHENIAIEIIQTEAQRLKKKKLQKSNSQ